MRGWPSLPSAVPSIFRWKSLSTRKPPAERYPSAGADPEAGCATLFEAYMVEKAKSQELSQQIEDLHAELVDLEHELTAGSFSLARFQESDEDMQYYTGFPSMAVFDLCAEFLELEHGLVLGERSRTEGRQRETGGGRKPKFNLRFYDNGPPQAWSGAQDAWSFVQFVRVRHEPHLQGYG